MGPAHQQAMELPRQPYGLFVPGIPQPKGSAKGFVVNGRAVVTSDNKKARHWATAIASLAQDVRDGVTHDPIRLRLTFFLPRPLGHFGVRGNLLPSAPRVPTVKPDIDKLERTVLDALTGIIFRDDNQVVELASRKVYADDRPPGVDIEIEELAR